MALFAALYSLRAGYVEGAAAPLLQKSSRYLIGLTVFAAVALWLTVIVGTYVTFPPYRAVPADALADLSHYPKALIQSNPGTAWLHSFAMESKEHVPWIAAMLATVVAFFGVHYRTHLLSDRHLNRTATALVAVCFALVAYLSILGVFVNKVAPLE